MSQPHQKLNRSAKAGADAAAYHLPSLTRVYGRALRAAGRRAATRMRQTAPLTAAAEPKQPNWTPPTADQLINQAELADDTQRKTAKLHREILTASARTALEPFGITFDIHAPTSQAVLDQFAARIQATITSAIAEQVTEAIQAGYANGDSVVKVSRAIQTATDEISRPRANMLARSDLNGLANSGSLLAASQSGAAATKTWLCLAGDTRVSGLPLRVARRLYTGELVTLATVSSGGFADATEPNSYLSVTADHPVLTRRGWIAAKFLEPGDCVFGCPALDGQRVMKPDVEAVPATIAEVFNAAANRGPTQRMVGRVVNFNGEWERGEIEVIAVDGELRDRFNAELCEPAQQLLLSLSDVRLAEALTDSATLDSEIAHWDTDAFEMALSSSGQGVLAVDRPARTAGLGLSANSHTALLEHPYEGRLRNTESRAKHSEGLASEIAPRCIVDVEISSRSGYVYDLETESGWLFANGIIVHNSTNDDLTRETHADADGQTVGIDDSFDVGGESAQYPGDPSLSWEESANCRCAIGYGEPLTGSTDPFEEALTRAVMAPIPAEVEAVDETGSVPARVHYRPADDPDQACDTCSYYRPGDSRCLMFPGDPEVLADYTCDEWVAETGAEGITSGGMATVEIDKLTLSERAKLAADLAEPLTPEAERLARVREALAASGVRDVFDDEELVAVIAAAEAIQRPAVTLTDLTLLAATEGGTPWQATLCVAGIPTVDSGIKRLLSADGGSWLPLPLPLAFMDDSPHADMVTRAPMCGRIDQIWWAGDVCQASGVFFDSSDDPEVAAAGSKAAAVVKEMRRMGISVDLVDTEIELVVWQEAGETLDEVNDPTQADDLGLPGGEVVEVLYDEAEEPDYIYLFRKWVIGGATICPVQALTQATISLIASSSAWSSVWRSVSEFGDATPPLTASAAGLAPERPPRAWFDEPERDEPTPLTVTDEGQVFGHMALWNSCHTGFAGQCVPPPKSPSDYSGFHLGEIPAADGSRVEVGTLTMDTGHAGKRLNAAAAVAHYDDTGTAAAYVRAKDGRFGIWVAGSLSARLDASDAQALMAAKPSGDWREIFRGMGRDMIGALMVNVPGFPVPRTLTASGLPYGDASVEFSSDCELCDESLARSLAVLSASVDGVEGLAALVEA